MKVEYEELIYEAAQRSHMGHQKFLATKDVVEKIIYKVQLEENTMFYEGILIPLINSINNAGCEERRSEQIALINREMGRIVDEYLGGM